MKPNLWTERYEAKSRAAAPKNGWFLRNSSEWSDCLYVYAVTPTGSVMGTFEDSEIQATIDLIAASAERGNRLAKRAIAAIADHRLRGGDVR